MRFPTIRFYSRAGAMFSNPNPHFFKVILGDTLRLKMLSIPEMFLRKYRETLSKTVHLKLPCGTEWKMKLLERQGRVWLKKGWSDFAEHYSIAEGQLLTFQYRGSSRFGVVIFDTTSTAEIDYPLLDWSENRQSEKNRVKDKLVEVFDDFKPLSLSSPRRKRVRESYNDDPQQSSNESFAEPSAPRRGKSSRNSCESGVKTAKARLTGTEKDQILERVHFNSERPFFKAVMQPSYVSPRGIYMPIPIDFARRHIKKERGDCVFRVPNEHRKTWSVHFTNFHPRTTKHFAMLTTGWSKFADINALETGDVCVFELIDETKYIFDVHVFQLPIAMITNGKKIKCG